MIDCINTLFRHAFNVAVFFVPCVRIQFGHSYLSNFPRFHRINHPSPPTASIPSFLPSANRPDIRGPRNTLSAPLGTHAPQNTPSHPPDTPYPRKTTSLHFLLPDTHDPLHIPANPLGIHGQPHKPSRQPDTPSRSNTLSVRTFPPKQPAPPPTQVKHFSYYLLFPFLAQ